MSSPCLILAASLLIAGARVEGSRPVAIATARYGDKLLCSSNYAEQSEVPFPRVAPRDACGEHMHLHTYTATFKSLPCCSAIVTQRLIDESSPKLKGCPCPNYSSGM